MSALVRVDLAVRDDAIDNTKKESKRVRGMLLVKCRLLRSLLKKRCASLSQERRRCLFDGASFGSDLMQILPLLEDIMFSICSKSCQP